MSHKWYFAMCVSSLLITCTVSISAQVVTKLTIGDANYILDLTPGINNAWITNDALLWEKECPARAGKGAQFIVDSDSWNFLECSINFGEADDSIKPDKSLIKRKFYNVTQISLLSFQQENPGTRIFNFPTTINGYQFAPGFCLGLGLMYNYYNKWYDFENVSFLPIFADIRSHLPQRGKNVAFFFKFDIGYNLVLTKRANFYSDVNPPHDITYSRLYQISDGGIMVSPGLGFRIKLSDLIHIIPSIEYFFAKSQTLHKHFRDGNLIDMYTYDRNFNYFKINIGIAFQY